ncbi:MAG: hypothetical protein KME13_11365 [Myxacorys californica WJT36-NPBG1]|nr:hypothetical protein [Myxacorys californica WJT36-NPBG1]
MLQVHKQYLSLEVEALLGAIVRLLGNPSRPQMPWRNIVSELESFWRDRQTILELPTCKELHCLEVGELLRDLSI